ncbi:Uncharacterised protein [Bordetella pertussis]|nr:Uncharacterised protein [Bordetella pertussis]CFW43204.1 Uncharacterised protein [Bordetella pertussis]
MPVPAGDWHPQTPTPACLSPTGRGACPRWDRHLQTPQGAGTRCRQHSTIFTANPPRAVSLYLVFMSAPVSRMVLMTESSDT